MQLKHLNSSFSEFNFEIILLCDGVNSPANMGSLLRVADSFGVKKVLFSKVIINIESSRLKRTARSTQKWVAIESNVDAQLVLKDYLDKGFVPVALEITETSIPLEKINFSDLEKVLLIIGDESSGVSDSILKACKFQTHITMFGKNSSMNVSQATAVALYEITKQFNNE